MPSSVEEISPLERVLNVEVPAEKISESYDRVFKDLQKNVSVKGFRKGKTPIPVIRKMYKEKVHQDVVQDVVHRGYFESLAEHKLNPISQPEFEFQQLQENQSFTFTAKFEVRPEVELQKYEGLPVEREILEISDEQVDEVIQNILNSRAENVAVFDDRPVADGDIACIDFEGFVDGAPLENGKAEGHDLEIGSNSFIEGFEEGILGMKAGDERTIDLKFPDEYHAADIAGKPVQFKVRLDSIKKKSTPELNDEFVKSLGGNHESVEQLTTEIREDLEQREQKRIDEEAKNRLLKELVRNNPVEVPPSMLKDQKQSLIDDFEKRMKSQGMSDQDFTDYRAKWDSDFEDSAKQMIQSSFLIDAISSKHELSAKPEDIDKKLEEISTQSGIEIDRIKEFYESSEQRSRLSFQVTEQNVIDFLLGSANIHEVPAEKLHESES